MIFADLAQWQSEIKKESRIRFMQQYYQGDQEIVGSIPTVGIDVEAAGGVWE